jgi:hypothetical protein
MLCPYTSPQNGKVERIIRSVNNVIHTLLIQASLPRRYWAVGLHSTMYLLNRLPTTTIQAVCPHLALFGSAPIYEHLRVFSCTCYPNKTATTPQKLSPHSTWCVFLGYYTKHKGYRCRSPLACGYGGRVWSPDQQWDLRAGSPTSGLQCCH